MNYIIIPARLASVRLPNKLLINVHGRPVIWYTISNALKSRLVDKIFVLTEDLEIYNAVKKFDLNVEPVMTPKASSGTERISIFVKKLVDSGCSKVVNLQGDEPMIKGSHIDALFSDIDPTIITMTTSITESEYKDPNVVKVVTDFNNRALYFSRSPVPYDDYINAKKHIGLYLYPIDFLLHMNKINESQYKNESLEQLSWLQSGWKIKTIHYEKIPLMIGINTRRDLNRFNEHIGTLNGL